MSPKISVIVPIWGVEKYIAKCARSLFESSFDDIEYIFVDDCTPDKSIDVLMAVMEEYPHRKSQSMIIRHENNKGLPQARKTGFEASHGQWITYCDSDDWVAPDMYFKMLEKADWGGGYDLVCCDFVYLSDSKELWRPTYDEKSDEGQLRKDLIEGQVSNAVWNKIVKREIYENGFYFPTYSMDEDDVITVQCAYYAKKCGYVHECLYYHYDNPDSMTKKSNPERELRKAKEQLENRKWIVSFLESRNDSSLVRALFNYKSSVKSLTFQVDQNPYSFKAIYPEINSQMILGKGFGMKRKISNLLLIYFPLLYLLIKRIK